MPIEKDITKADVSWGTLHVIFPKLLRYGIVVQTRTIGRAKLYKINKESEIAKRVMGLYNSLIKEALSAKDKNKKMAVA